MKRLIVMSVAFYSAVVLRVIALQEGTPAIKQDGVSAKKQQGHSIFRFDPYGDEQLWAETLRLQGPIEGMFDGTNIAPLNSASVPMFIPPAFGLQAPGRRGLWDTYSGDGKISYWTTMSPSPTWAAMAASATRASASPLQHALIP